MTNDVVAFTYHNGAYYLDGAINFETAPAWQKASETLFRESQGKTIILNFSQLESPVSSAALALLVEWLRLSSRYHVTLQYDALPKTLLSIAEISGVSELM